MRKKTAKLLKEFAREAFQAEQDSLPDGKEPAHSPDRVYGILKNRWANLSPNEKRVLASEMRGFLRERNELAQLDL